MAITNTPNEVLNQAYKSDKRAWFAQKHTHLSSYQPGYEHPDLVVPITGNTTVKLNMSRYLQSAPTVTPIFDSMRVNFRVFFAPQRLYTRGLYGNNFEEVDDILQVELPSFSTGVHPDSMDSAQVFVVSRGSLLNRLGYPAGFIWGNNYLPLDKDHYLPDDLNAPLDVFYESGFSSQRFNATPIVAYFDIWNHYIRNPYLEDVPVTQAVLYEGTPGEDPLGLFDPSVVYEPAQALVNAVVGIRGISTDTLGTTVYSPSTYILGMYNHCSDDGANDVVFDFPRFASVVPLMDSTLFGPSDTISSVLSGIGDFVTPTGMLPTNFGEHYQTMFYSEDDINKLQSIVIETDADGKPTVEGLRLGKSVWNRALRTILHGRKYTDWVDVQFGSKLKISDHPIFVGSDSMLISFQDVVNQSAQGTVPLGKAAGAGARGGKGADGDRTIVFTAQEPGYLMVLVDFVPEISYTDVLPRWAEFDSMSSFPLPAYSGMQWQDLKGSDLVYTGTSFDDTVIGKQPIYFDFMSSYNRTSALFNTRAFRPYTFQRRFDLSLLEEQVGLANYVQSTYILPTTFDYNFADIGQNGRQNFWMKTEYNIRLYQPLDKQVVSGRI